MDRYDQEISEIFYEIVVDFFLLAIVYLIIKYT